MPEIDGFILAGGASSRMGTDKAHLRLGGRTLVECVAAALGAIAKRVAVVSAKPDAGSWDLPVVRDVHHGLGAMGGLHAALCAGQTEWVAVVSCDLPFVTGEVFARLTTYTDELSDAVVPVQTDGRVQPLCALYRRTACLKVVEELIQSGEFRPRVLVRRVRTRVVTTDELSDVSGATRFFINVNTPEDYSRAQALLKTGERRHTHQLRS
ncbi:MAG TPA: molybdenum cofactor guanylyltransferase [Pyrinomonadaceae bacterium]|nr:molybdenum cofactor guanylyltransferase [Pyrinomonadaceae bacterium]